MCCLCKVLDEQLQINKVDESVERFLKYHPKSQKANPVIIMVDKQQWVDLHNVVSVLLRE